MPTVRDAALDLILGGACLGCDRPGRLVCRTCTAQLPAEAWPAWPTPTPPGLAQPWAAAPYAGLVRSLVLGHKEHRQLGLRPVLGDLLTLAAAADLDVTTPLVLVPVPSRPGVVRARGHDPTGEVTAAAGARLRAAGADVTVARLLASRRGVADQAGLSATDRAANLAGSMHCRAGALRRLATWRERVQVVVCDDVLTTGATAREAQRALETVGLPVAAVAVVAATRRRLVSE